MTPETWLFHGQAKKEAGEEEEKPLKITLPSSPVKRKLVLSCPLPPFHNLRFSTDQHTFSAHTQGQLPYHLLSPASQNWWPEQRSSFLALPCATNRLAMPSLPVSMWHMAALHPCSSTHCGSAFHPRQQSLTSTHAIRSSAGGAFPIFSFLVLLSMLNRIFRHAQLSCRVCN